MVSAPPDPSDRPVVERFAFRWRPGYLMRRGVTHLATVRAAHDPAMTVPRFERSRDEALLSRLTPAEGRRFIQVFRKALDLDHDD